MDLVEYIYTDDKRLDAYVEQFGSPLTVQTAGSFKAGLSFTGLSVEGSAGSHVRALTGSEKIEAVVGLHNFDVEQVDKFVDATIAARRFVLEGDRGPLCMWVAHIEAKPDDLRERGYKLFLIEDFVSNDARPRLYSSYSSLYLLLEELDIEGRKSGTKLDDLDKGGLSNNTAQTLIQIGAKAGPMQTIRTVFRFRAYATDMFADYGGTVIGYPIYIERVHEV